MSLSLLFAACADNVRENAPRHTRSTYGKFLVLATKGDASAQNLVGFMLFFGENVAEDKQEAHLWFHRAAELGHGAAQLNLAIMHGLGQDAALDHNEAQRMYAAIQVNDGSASPTLGDAMAAMRDEGSEKPPPGRRDYESFCAGCHGLNGVARYVVSPSFAIGERMEKTDAELSRSIALGLGVMPGWYSMLSDVERKQILAYIRTLVDHYRKGIAGNLRGVPEQYFIFGPMVNEEFESEEPGIRTQPYSQ